MTYEYVCTACGNEWEAEQPISEAPLKTCPKCQHETARRQVSGGQGFILKGGGWYADGYGSPGAKKSDGEGSTASKTETKKEGSKSEPSKSDKTDSPKSDKTDSPKEKTTSDSSKTDPNPTSTPKAGTSSPSAVA
jgi:putative FmdB family regulatory protein